MTIMTSSTKLPLNAGDPVKAKPHLDRAQQLESTGNRDAAIAAYRDALSEHHSAETVFALARLLDRVGQDE